MNVLIIFSHPGKKSYTHQILEHLKGELIRKNFVVEVSDLYALNFQSNLSEEEYEREVFNKSELSIAPDIVAEHGKIDTADCIIFLYPVWWSDCPAILKGWFDRVYTVGYAYKQKDDTPKMKTIKYGFAICTAGYSNTTLTETGIAQSMENIMMNDRLGQRFEYKEMLILGGTLGLDNVRESHQDQIKKLVSKIEI